MGVYFYPRGGSAHVCRALAREFERNGIEVTVLSGSRSDLGEHALASSFYSGLDLRAVDFTPALRSEDPIRFDGPAGTAPMHGSYEDRRRGRGPGPGVSRRRGLRAPGRGLGAGAAAGRRRRRRPSLPAPPEPAQRGGGARVPGDPGARPRARHRAADAGADRRRRPGRLDARRALGRADIRLGGRLRAVGGQRPSQANGGPRPCSTSTPIASSALPTASTPASRRARSIAAPTGAATWSSGPRAGGRGRGREASSTRRPTSSR